jgi:hypothetical protein
MMNEVKLDTSNRLSAHSRVLINIHKEYWNMKSFTRGLTLSAISMAGLLALAGCSSHEEVRSVQPPPQVIVEPAPVVVPSQTVTEKTTTVSPAPAPVLTEQTTTQRSVKDSVDNSGPDVSQQRTSSYHSETTTVTPAPPATSETTTTYKKTYDSSY